MILLLATPEAAIQELKNFGFVGAMTLAVFLLGFALSTLLSRWNFYMRTKPPPVPSTKPTLSLDAVHQDKVAALSDEVAQMNWQADENERADFEKWKLEYAHRTAEFMRYMNGAG